MFQTNSQLMDRSLFWGSRRRWRDDSHRGLHRWWHQRSSQVVRHVPSTTGMNHFLLHETLKASPKSMRYEAQHSQDRTVQRIQVEKKTSVQASTSGGIAYRDKRIQIPATGSKARLAAENMQDLFFNSSWSMVWIWTESSRALLVSIGGPAFYMLDGVVPRPDVGQLIVSPLENLAAPVAIPESSKNSCEDGVKCLSFSMF